MLHDVEDVDADGTRRAQQNEPALLTIVDRCGGHKLWFKRIGARSTRLIHRRIRLLWQPERRGCGRRDTARGEASWPSSAMHLHSPRSEPRWLAAGRAQSFGSAVRPPDRVQ